MSTMADGSMSKAVGAMEKKANRTRFLATHGLTPDQTILVHLTYDSDDYCRYVTVGAEQAGDGITQEPSFITDALFTAEKNVVFMLPIADCIGAVIYDPVKQVIGLAHLGRHNLEQHGGTALINYMTTEFGVSPSTIQVWLSPAAGRGNYPLHSFDNRSLHEVALEQLMAASVNIENITVDTRDTTTNPGLFSHSEFLKGNRPSDGRQAVICMVKPSGE
mgnify:CR=1 FL=1